MPSWQPSFLQPPPTYSQQPVYASHPSNFPPNMLSRPQHPMSSQPPPPFAAAPPTITYQQLSENVMENTERRLSDYDPPTMMSGVRQMAPPFSQFRMPRIPQAPDSQMPQQASHVMMTPESPDQRMSRMPMGPPMLPPRPVTHQMVHVSEVPRHNVMPMSSRMSVPNAQFVPQMYDGNTVNRNPAPRFPQMVPAMRPAPPSEYSSSGNAVSMQAHSGAPQYYPNPPAAHNSIIQQSQNAMRPSLALQYVQQQPDALSVTYQSPQMVQGMGSSNFPTQHSSDNDVTQTAAQNYVNTGVQVHQPQESSTYVCVV
jgi:hypothetical protein